jgi:hypothetical protein
VPVHRDITTRAVADANLTEAQKSRIVAGSQDGDLDEGGLPLTGGRYDRRFHFDNCFSYQAVMQNFTEVAGLIDGTLATNDRNPWVFGMELHAIEDFYSHSNYIPLFFDYVAQTGNEMVGAVPPIEQVLRQPMKYKRFIEMLKKDLHTGRYPDAGWLLAKDTDHGPIAGLGGGMHKDVAGRDYYIRAREAATEAVTWYVRLYTGDAQARREWVAIKAVFLAGTR